MFDDAQLAAIDFLREYAVNRGIITQPTSLIWIQPTILDILRNTPQQDYPESFLKRLKPGLYIVWDFSKIRSSMEFLGEDATVAYTVLQKKSAVIPYNSFIMETPNYAN